MEQPQKDNNYFNSGTLEFLSKYGLQKIHYSFFDKFRFIIGAGLGLVAAMAWDDFFRSLFGKIFIETNSTTGKFFYAFLLTISATIIAIILGRISKRKRNKVKVGQSQVR